MIILAHRRSLRDRRGSCLTTRPQSTSMLLKEDMAMRTVLDFSPLHRSSIGFDRVFDLLETAASSNPQDNWPPFDSIKVTEDHYRITMAVAGFTAEDLRSEAHV